MEKIRAMLAEIQEDIEALHRADHVAPDVDLRRQAIERLRYKVAAVLEEAASV